MSSRQLDAEDRVDVGIGAEEQEQQKKEGAQGAS